MKKAFTLLILLIYFAVSTGFVISLHYCMDRLDSFELGSVRNDKCGKCGMHKGEGCCHDVVKIVKLNQSHVASSPASIPFQAAVAHVVLTDYRSLPLTSVDTVIPVRQNSPPVPITDIQLRNCVFRI